jgi:hypothetical protein
MNLPAPEALLAPPVVALFGWLGLIPFLGLPIIWCAIAAVSGLAGTVPIAYGALILSFLGGARWGLAVAHRGPRALKISLAMLPTLVALI